MATVSHTIYSRYDPADREKLEKETGQAADEDESEDWALKSAFLRRTKPPPRFVPATVAFDDWSPSTSSRSLSFDSKATSSRSTDVADWYRSLAGRRSSAAPSQSVPSSSAGFDHIRRPRTAPTFPALHTSEAKKPDKNDWFIQNVLHNPAEQLSQPAPSTSSLADMITRDPPPMPHEQPFKPPVFLALGPANRGWGMLQKSGWREGETLGPNARRAAPPSPSRKGKERAPPPHQAKSEDVEVSLDDDGEITEIRKVDVVDLTVSDSDDGDDDTDEDDIEEIEPDATLCHGVEEAITHNAAALAAHIRSAEQVRRRKEEMGRGYRAFQRQDKRDQRNRRDLLAYLNS
ncbi:hypothetical protein BD626DRAFT_493889 [Schizophyllum amplum]|uniref:G-patch domain-containing protein n=1 Tax=Schizophyllum amplum TaxID=97359 RepID=A0A550CH52_9AGAR|nr:hypothetical protein BD626DRAFT_493889 [Auriculariopsis ampla]